MKNNVVAVANFTNLRPLLIALAWLLPLNVALAAFDFAEGMVPSRTVQKDNTSEVFEIAFSGDEAWTATTDSAVSDGGWINLRRRTSSDCSRPATYKVAHNYSTDSRTGHIYINNLTYTVTQLGYGAVLSPSGSVSIPAVGTTASGQVSFEIEPATDGSREISWTARSDAEWVTVMPASGDGNSVVYYSVEENTSETERRATLTIAGQEFSIVQSGAEIVDPNANKVWLIPDGAITVPCSAQEFDVSLATADDVAWTAVPDAEWVQITTTTTGTGPSALHVYLPENLSVMTRTGVISVNGTTLMIKQLGSTDYALNLNPLSSMFEFTGGISNVFVTALQDMSWTAKSSMPWVRITSGSSGAGPGDVRYVVSANPTLQERTAEIEVEAWVPYPEIDIARGLTQWKGESWLKWTDFNDPSVRDADVQGCTEGVWFRVTETNALNRLFDLNNGAASLYVQEFQNRLVYDAPDGSIIDLGFSVTTNVTYDLFLVTTPTTTAIYGGIHDSGVYRHLYTDNRSLRITNYKHTTKPSEDWLVKGDASTQAYYFWNRPLTETELLNLPAEAPLIPAVAGDVYSTLYSHAPMDRFRVWKADGTEEILSASNVIVTVGREGLHHKALSGGVIQSNEEIGLVFIRTPIAYDRVNGYYRFGYYEILSNLSLIYGCKECWTNYYSYGFSDIIWRIDAEEEVAKHIDTICSVNIWMKLDDIEEYEHPLFSILREAAIDRTIPKNYYRTYKTRRAAQLDKGVDAYKLQVSSNGFSFVENSVKSADFGGDKLQQGKWHMLTVTSNGSKMTMYLDGEDIGTMALAGGYDYFCLDSWCAYGNGGKIVFDDIKTFTSCLTTDQINEIYNLEKPLKRKLSITQGIATATLSETLLECSSRGDTQTISLSLPVRNIQWTADPLVDWIAAEPASGTGSTNITLTIGKNYETNERTGVIMIAGVPVTIHQRRAGVTVPYDPIIADFDGETLFVPIEADDEDTHWIVEDYPDDWMYAIDEDGVGSTDMEIDIDEMGQGVSLSSRVGAVTVSGERFYVVQRDFVPTITPCSTTARYNTPGGTIQVNTEDGIEYWEAVSDADWITIDGNDNGIGNGTVAYTLSENITDKARTGRIIIAGEVCTITQTPSPVVSGLEISGADSLLAGETASYTGHVLYSDGSFVDANNVAWSVVEGSPATIDANGHLTVGTSRSVVVVSASCIVEGLELSASKEVSVLAKPVSLVAFVGQDLFCPGWTAQVDFFAAYADGMTNAVRPDVSIVGDATIDDDGFLTIGTSAGTVAINASYEENGVAVQTTKTLTVRPPITINEALGDSPLPYTSGGNSAWMVDPWHSYDGTFSAKSGQVQAGQTSDIRTVVDGAGAISFWVKVSVAESLRNSAFIFMVDGVPAVVLSGATDWTNIVHEITKYDEHELVWRYAKGASDGHDSEECAWIDEVVWMAGPADPIPRIATDSEVADALDGSADSNLAANITSRTEYNAYRAWVDKRGLGHKAVKAAPKSWLSYALDANVLIDRRFRKDDLSIDMFAQSSAGGFLFELGLNGVEIGDKATAANLAKIFGIEGTSALDHNDFSSDNVTFSFGAPNDGKATIVAEPKDGNAESFFLRATMRDFYDDVPVVSLSLNGGGSLNGASEEMLVDRDAEYGTLPTPTRTGHTFDGWYTKATGGTKVTGSTTITTNSSHALYAHWTPNTYTITFDPNGGSVSPTTKTVTYGASYGDMPTPERIGYTFAGWYTASSGGMKTSGETSVTTASDHSLYAHWTASTYTVTFNPNGGNVSPTSMSVTYDSTYGDMPTATRTGYTFDGWYTASVGGTKVISATSVTSSTAHTLYAHWTADMYVIALDPNGGQISQKTISVAYGEPFGELPTPTRTGHEFLGWYSLPDGGFPVSAASVPFDSVQTLFARWISFSYVVKNGMATITGSSDAAGSITIPNNIDGYPVIAIADDAFRVVDSYSGLAAITNVVIPYGIRNIGNRAFYNCSQLANITIANSVTNIGDMAFMSCFNLANIQLPTSLMSIGARAFCSCFRLTSVEIPEGIEAINESLFNGCSSLERVLIPESVVCIKSWAFGNCRSLSDVVIPNGVTNIYDDVFAGCRSLISITIPDSVTTLGSAAFIGCTNLTSVTIGKRVANIEHQTFERCTNLKNVVFGGDIETIGKWAFKSCSSLERVTIPQSVTSIKDSAFSDCTNLKKAYVPYALEMQIETNSVFSGCDPSLAIIYY